VSVTVTNTGTAYCNEGSATLFPLTYNTQTVSPTAGYILSYTQMHQFSRTLQSLTDIEWKCPVPKFRPQTTTSTASAADIHWHYAASAVGRRPSHCSAPFVKDCNTEFNENLTNGLLAETRWQTDRRTDGLLLRKYRVNKSKFYSGRN